MKKQLIFILFLYNVFDLIGEVVVDENFELVNTVTKIQVPKDDYSKNLKIKIRGLSDGTVSIINHKNLKQRDVTKTGAGKKVSKNLLKLDELYDKNVLQVLVPGGYYVTDSVGMTVPPELLEDDEGVSAGVIFNLGQNADVMMNALSFNYQKIVSKLYTMALFYSVDNGESWTLFDTVVNDKVSNEDQAEKANFYIYNTAPLEGVDCLKVVFWGHTERSGEAQGSTLAYIIDNLVIRRVDNKKAAFSDIKDLKILEETRRIVGWRFTPEKHITVTDLGLLDPKMNKFRNKTKVRIYDLNSAQTVVEAVLQGRVLPERLGNYDNYFIPVAPVILEKGRPYVILAENPHDYAQRVEAQTAEEIGFENIGISYNKKKMPDMLSDVEGHSHKTPYCFIGPTFKFKASDAASLLKGNTVKTPVTKKGIPVRGGYVTQTSEVSDRKLRWEKEDGSYIYLTPKPKHKFINVVFSIEPGYSLSTFDYKLSYKNGLYKADSLAIVKGRKRAPYGINGVYGEAQKASASFSLLYEVPAETTLFNLIFGLNTSVGVPSTNGIPLPFPRK